MNQTKVLIVYPYLQHYRLGVFQEMDNSRGIKYTFVSDVKGRRGIEPLSPAVVSHHVLAPRIEIGPFYWQKGLIPLIASGEYDAVVFFAEIPALTTWLGSLLARLRRKPVFFWTTGWHRPEQGLKRIFRNAFYSLSDQLLLYGELGRTIGEQMKYPPEKMSVIGNSVETKSSTLDKSETWEYEKSPGSIVVGAVIRLIPVKQLDLILKAVSQLAESDPSLKISVLIVGEGPERDRLEKLAEALHVELALPGAFYSSKVLGQVYDALDITVVPAAVGLTAIQSMSHGVPVISNDSAYTQMPEWESIKQGQTGELFEEGNVDGLADAIRKIAKLHPDARLQLSQNCKNEVSRNWTSKAHASRISHAITTFMS